MTTNLSDTRLVSIDVLRALAALSVLISHLYSVLEVGGRSYPFDAVVDSVNRIFLYIFRNGGEGGNHPGVVVFIVLSGFCIHAILARAPERARASGYWTQYLVRRFFRIYPVYLVGIGLGVTALAIIHGLGYSPTFHGTEISPLSVVAKVFLLSPLLPGIDPGSGNVPLETVATEMWLYAAYPLVFLLAHRAPLGACGFVLGLHVVSVVALFGGIDPVAMYSSFPRFLLYWVLGAAAAEYFYRDTEKGFGVLIFFTVLTYALLVIANCLLGFKGAYLIRMPLMALFVATALVTILTAEQRFGFAGRALSLLAWLGERSYSLYVVHMPVLLVVWGFSTAGFFSHDTIIGPRLMAFFASLTVMCFTYRAIERPSHRYARSAAAKLSVQSE